MHAQHPPAVAGGARTWLLYGANGYTGKLIAEEAVRRGLRPVLAGRSEAHIRPLAEELGCPYRVFSLNDIGEIKQSLADVQAVLHCAGPFSRTAMPMVRACIETGVHYADITGEIPVLEEIYTQDSIAREAGVTLLPGAGYDVVPTDCLAAMLHAELPDATHLRIAFAGKISQSPGTWAVTLEAIPKCGMIRKDGALTSVPHAWKIEGVTFDDGRHCTMSIPWGDVASAYRSTGIPNIHVAIGVSRLSAMTMRMVRGVVCALLRPPAVLRMFKALVPHMVKGPSEKTRRTVIYHLRGDVWREDGERRSICMHTPEGYTTTVESTLAIMPSLVEGTLPPGAITPSKAMGAAFALQLNGVRTVDCP